MADDVKKVDGVFEGGGVKGIALIGAAEVVEEAGYVFQNLAGTSAGAIVATLLAAGYSAAEIKPILLALDFSQFMDASLLGKVPLVGPEYDLIRHWGLYKGDYFLELMRGLLTKKLGKDRVTFADLRMPGATDEKYRFKVNVIASDISRGRMLVLPGGIADYGLVPEELEVAVAVRMSMSIPFFFVPMEQTNPQGQTCYIVDGGILSNFPIELFDAPDPEWPTFGFALVAPKSMRSPDSAVVHHIHGPATMLWAMFNTAMEAHDAYYMTQPDVAARTIRIDNLGISSTDFNLTAAQKEQLFESGRAGGRAFLATWDFERYKQEFRSGRPNVRRLPLAAVTQPVTGPTT